MKNGKNACLDAKRLAHWIAVKNTFFGHCHVAMPFFQCSDYDTELEQDQDDDEGVMRNSNGDDWGGK